MEGCVQAAICDHVALRVVFLDPIRDLDQNANAATPSVAFGPYLLSSRENWRPCRVCTRSQRLMDDQALCRC